MKVIIHAEPEDIESVARLILRERETFARSGGRIGWGWEFKADNDKRYFVREIKGGFSAHPDKTGGDHADQ